MSGEASGPRNGVPVPPAVTRPVRDPAVSGGLVPPFVPRWASRNRQARPVAAAGPAPTHAAATGPTPPANQPPQPTQPRAATPAWHDRLLEDTDRWPDLPELGSATPAWGDVDPADIRNEDADAVERRALADRVADRLEAMARTVRDHGLGGLGRAAREDELARLIAGVVAGFYSREEDR